MTANQLATIGLVLAIIAMASHTMIGSFGGFLIGLVGLIFGSIALQRINGQGDKKGKGKAIIAIVIGILWFLILLPTLLASLHA